MKDIDKELDELVKNLYLWGAGSKSENTDFGTVVTDTQAKQAIKQLINQARIDELNGYCKFLNDKPADSIVYATELVDRYLDRLKELRGNK